MSAAWFQSKAAIDFDGCRPGWRALLVFCRLVLHKLHRQAADCCLAVFGGGPNAPTDAYAATSYGSTAYWIDRNDFDSKQTFALLMVFTSLAETGTAAQIPILTVPVH